MGNGALQEMNLCGKSGKGGREFEIFAKANSVRSTYLDLKPLEKRRLRGSPQTLFNRVKLQRELERGMSQGVERWESVRVLQSGRGIFVGRKERYQPRL